MMDRRASSSSTDTDQIVARLLPNDHHDDDEANYNDHCRLQQLGYKQELSRTLSAVSNFALTFSIISVLTGITTLYGAGLEFGGPLSLIYGWLIAGAFTLVVGISMAEICSAFPTSGGLYFWSAKLCGQQWGPFASWITGWLCEKIQALPAELETSSKSSSKRRKKVRPVTTKLLHGKEDGSNKLVLLGSIPSESQNGMPAGRLYVNCPVLDEFGMGHGLPVTGPANSIPYGVVSEIVPF